MTASDLISPHYTCSPTLQLVLFYDVHPLTMVPEQVHLHGQWLGKRHQEFPSNGWGEFTYTCRCQEVHYNYHHPSMNHL
jgi:hypothetical protein